MNAQASPTNPVFLQLTAVFGKARARQRRALERLAQSTAAFVAAQDARASTDAISAVLPALHERASKLADQKVISTTVERAYRLAADVQKSILEKPIAQDIAEEARDAGIHDGEAKVLLAVLDELCRANDALIAACETLGDEFDEGEETMADTASKEAPEPRGSGAFRMPRSTGMHVKADSVASQLVATLDKLGLPHIGGALSGGDDPDGRLTQQLIHALDDQFEIYDSETGRRARSRRRPLGAFRGKPMKLTGRLKIDAQAIDIDALRLGDILDGIDNQLRFAERSRLVSQSSLARRLVDERLGEVRALAASPHGIPARQARIKATQLEAATLSFLSSIGVEIDPKGIAFDNDDPFDADAITLPASPTSREELISEVVEACEILAAIRRRLDRSSAQQSDAELGYRLDRSLAEASRSAGVVLGFLQGVEMAPTLNVWESIDIDVKDSSDSPENLGNGLSDALGWLAGVAAPFGDGTRSAETMSRLALAGLAAELDEIANVLSACADRLQDSDLEEPAATVAEQTAGLGLIARKCAEFAARLGR